MSGAPYDAIILAGGRAHRLDGVSKPDVRLCGRRLLDLTLASTTTARRRVVVGPASLQVPTDVLRTQETPAHGGPVAGIEAGLAALLAAWPDPDLPDDTPVLVLACDMPFIGRALPPLLTSLGEADGAHLLDGDGRAQWLAAVYRPGSLRRALDDLARDGGTRNAPVRRLTAGLTLVGVPVKGGECADIDTWADHALLEAVASRPAPDVPVLALANRPRPSPPAAATNTTVFSS